MRKLYMNGRFYTFDDVIPSAEAVVSEDGHIVDLGTTESMMKKWNHQPDTKIIDLQGKAVTPGLTDSHVHISGIAGQFLNLDVSTVTSREEMLQRIAKWAHTLEVGQWLVGRGWNENLFPDGVIPTIEELDSVAPDNPLFIPRICGHAFLVNSLALRVSGYHPDIEVPEGGTIVLDEKTNKPTGLLLEAASEIIQKHIPNPSYEEWKDALRKAMNFAMEKGLTSVHTNDPSYIGGLNKTYQLFDELLNEEELGLRCNLLINHEFMDDLYANGMYTGYGNDTLQIGAIKVFADGAFGRRTALLSEPYADAPESYGDAMYSQAELRDIVRRARDLNMPLAVHTIGDQALENMLDVLDEFPTVAYRDRLIHVQVLRDDLIERLVSRSRIVDIQPRFLAGDYPWVQDRIGKERSKLSYAWQTLISSGVVCAGGSDCPVEPVDPLLGIHAAVTRKVPGEDHDGYNPREKLSMYEAFELFTKMGAYPTNEETVKGTISFGKFADMTVYSQDPFELEDPDELLKMDIEMTIIGGEVRYLKE